MIAIVVCIGLVLVAVGVFAVWEGSAHGDPLNVLAGGLLLIFAMMCAVGVGYAWGRGAASLETARVQTREVLVEGEDGSTEWRVERKEGE